MTMQEKRVVLAGNPNVGKSTVFNGLTGLRQHTGNWAGKTVGLARGTARAGAWRLELVDTPGAYSLFPHSAEEEAARDGVCLGEAELALVVCDAGCLERNLNLVLQVLEARGGGVVCVNLMDEAQKRGLQFDLPRLSRALGVPVIPAAARQGIGLEDVKTALCGNGGTFVPTVYPAVVEQAIERLEPVLAGQKLRGLNRRWLALSLIQQDESLRQPLADFLGYDLTGIPAVAAALEEIWGRTPAEALRDVVAETLVRRAEALARQAVAEPGQASRSREWDRLLTGRWTGLPLMLALLCLLFYITLAAANGPSAGLSALFDRGGAALARGLAGTPSWLRGLLVDGVYRVTGWVVAVMLPPMAIFFPLFTLLEDWGYLPRVAFNLDKGFQRCRACGKQALTICMGFGCNAVGVEGCRIIDSPRERRIAQLTNAFVPCNGRFPLLLTVAGLFLAGNGWGAALCLTGLVLLGVGLTFLWSRLLSATLLRGMPSAFTLELPPYRRPRVGQVLVRSVLDRTLFVLGRAVAVAAPAGAVIWLLAHVSVGGDTLLSQGAALLAGPGRFLGLDGAILLAFLLAFPANELVLPLVVMIYLAAGQVTELPETAALGELLRQNGWTGTTALCTLLFSLCHWPCSTTCLTIRRETGSWGWTAIGMLLPTLTGVGLCGLVAAVSRIFHLI